MTPPGPRHRFDEQDPFGSRPDEKPPQGWEDGFWEDVRGRIQRADQDPLPPREPAPPPGPRPQPSAVARLLAGALISGAAFLALQGQLRVRRDEPPPSESLTVVRVDGSVEPDVSVEWARSGGRRSGYVVLQSVDPEVSYVLIDSRLVRP